MVTTDLDKSEADTVCLQLCQPISCQSTNCNSILSSAADLKFLAGGLLEDISRPVRKEEAKLL